MRKDRFFQIALAGLTGAVATELLQWSMVLLGWTHSTSGHYLGAIIFASVKLDSARILVGELAHLIASAALGIPVYFVLSLSGRDFAVAKGGASGAVFWLNHAIIVPSFVAARVPLRCSPAESLIDLLALVLWGAITAYVLTRFGLPDSQTATQPQQRPPTPP